MASLDLERDLAIIALSGSRLTEVELEWAVTANGPLPFDAWAMTPGRCQAEACVLDAFGIDQGEVVRRWPNLLASTAVFKFDRP